MAHIGDFQMPQLDPKQTKRAVRWFKIIAGILGLIVFLLAALNPYVDYLWYLHDVRQPQVFTLAYQTRALLFVPSFLFTWALLFFSLRRALKLSLVYIDTPETRGQVLLSNALHFVQKRGWGLVRLAAPVFAFFSATSFSNEWSTLLLARHTQSFGKSDPIFGFDLGFFVFTLPWYRALVNYAFSIVVLTAVLTIGVYVGLQALAALARIELGRPGIRLHVNLLVGAGLLVLAGQMWLKTYEFGLKPGAQFTGAGYAATFELHAQQAVAILTALLGLLAFALVRSANGYRYLIRGAITVIAVSLLGTAAAPALIQRILVEPDKIGKESPYAARAIALTRFGYDLDRIAPRDFPVQNIPTPQDVAQSKATLDNMRLWDPEIVRQSFEVLQGLKPYYQFRDVDVDRYSIGGKTSMVMLSPRDIELSGLSDNARTWVNERLQYTHGFGVAMSSVNSATTDGLPSLLIRDIPPTTIPDIPLTEPRIYYSDFRDADEGLVDEYSLVNSNQKEFDYPAQDQAQTYRWLGDRGIPIGGFFRKLALSIVLGDGNLLVSGNIASDSRLLMHKSILDRCARLYPFLKLDNDPYIVLLDGKIYWILDGYTSSANLPYSDMSGEGVNRLNYIRNSVKIVVDAYSGETTAYAIQDEPVLRAYRAIYPGLVKDGAEIPAAFRAHFRYPEDLFRLQAGEMTQYHVSDPVTFLNNNDAWELPRQRGLDGREMILPPYYVQMRLPGENDEGFVLMLPFTPRSKPNMSGWLAAHCDPDRYGEMTLYNFARGANVAGAEQMETNFTGDPKVNSAILQLQGGGQTQVIIGNMLVIPIGKSVIYAESLFPKSRAAGLQATPRLKKIVLGLNGRIEIGDTYQEALDKLLGGEAAAPTQPPKDQPQQPGQKPAPNQGQTAGIREALGVLDQAEAALRAGDFAKYGELQKKARQKLQALAK